MLKIRKKSYACMLALIAVNTLYSQNLLDYFNDRLIFEAGSPIEYSLDGWPYKSDMSLAQREKIGYRRDIVLLADVPPGSPVVMEDGKAMYIKDSNGIYAISGAWSTDRKWFYFIGQDRGKINYLVSIGPMDDPDPTKWIIHETPLSASYPYSIRFFLLSPDERNLYIDGTVFSSAKPLRLSAPGEIRSKRPDLRKITENGFTEQVFWRDDSSQLLFLNGHRYRQDNYAYTAFISDIVTSEIYVLPSIDMGWGPTKEYIHDYLFTSDFIFIHWLPEPERLADIWNKPFRLTTAMIIDHSFDRIFYLENGETPKWTNLRNNCNFDKVNGVTEKVVSPLWHMYVTKIAPSSQKFDYPGFFEVRTVKKNETIKKDWGSKKEVELSAMILVYHPVSSHWNEVPLSAIQIR